MKAMKRLHLNLDLTSIIVLIAVGVLLPVMLSTAAGIVALVIAEDAGDIVTGVLMISFTVTAAGCALITVVLTSRKARLARRQADFVANVSHEFRTPLSAIRLYTQTLQSGNLESDPGRTAECLATILRETEWLDAMVDRVLTWRASSRDMLPLNKVSRPVSSAVNDALARFRSMVDPETLTLDVSVQTHLPVLHDGSALGAAVLNLLTNAYKYTDEPHRIELNARDDDGQVVIEVRDNGIGLAPAEAKRVFQPFYRARRADGSETSGAGLGLAITRHLVRRHDGTIDVSSEKDVGSTFTIRLPTAAGEA